MSSILSKISFLVQCVCSDLSIFFALFWANKNCIVSPNVSIIFARSYLKFSLEVSTVEMIHIQMRVLKHTLLEQSDTPDFCSSISAVAVCKS